MQLVTRCFAEWFGKYRQRGGHARFLKRKAHRRHRAEVRRYLAHEDWDGDVIASRPITSWDAD